SSPTPERSTLRYRHRALQLIALYVPLLIIPWVLTCVLDYHPADRASYFNQSGLSQSSLTLHRRLVNALAVLNSFASIVTIPIISALLAQAAVVYTQKRRKNQTVSVRQAFALADRGWSNLSILQEAWPPGTGPGSLFLWLATLFLLICGIQQPIREGVVDSEQSLVMTSQDNLVTRQSSRLSTLRTLGYDPEPDDLASIPEDVVVQDLANTLSSFSNYESPPLLWPDLEHYRPYKVQMISGRRFNPWAQYPTGYFVAALPNGTTTGVLRHRAMRLNSTVECEVIDRSAFPSPCHGGNPFLTAFGRTGLNVRLCVPGQRGKFPWNITRNRQDIVEEVFVDASGSLNASEPWNFTRHCSVQTTRGYFELGNYRNKYTQGPLLDRWDEPNPFGEQSEYNDWLSITDIEGWPIRDSWNSTWPATPGSNNTNLTASGPLMASILAMFGDRSLFALANRSTDATSGLAMSQICQAGRMPFSTFNGHAQYIRACTDFGEDHDRALVAIMRKFIASTFNSTDEGVRYLSASIFFANQAMLLQTAEKTEGFTARPIYTAAGQLISKPVVSPTGRIIVSVLILAQLIGLAYLAWYIYQVPTWTAMLDALAVARITNSLNKGDIPGIGSMSTGDLRRLEETDGLVGII
ncbi:hypothetical protein BKA66DRAFT_382204, partial [Pyrenochaeta sp. MPI-SDFR-AT-0127]